jgi:metallo-beta-lactamase class B
MHVYFLYILFALLPLISPFSPLQEIEVIQLKEGVFVYRSFALYEGSLVSANGLILESSDEVALIDTPWDDQQTVQLLNWIDREIGKPVSFAVITHAHMDRIGGIDVLKSRNISTISGRLTAKEAALRGYSQPDITFLSDTLLSYGVSSLEVFYPGPGHTIDNSVVYLSDYHMLYGGCFIKSAASRSLGNLDDAVVADWPGSLKRVSERYPERKVVIPGHGSWEPGAIENTLNLLGKMD